ncbi:type II restriction enzyme [Corynebacterium sp. 335C]
MGSGGTRNDVAWAAAVDALELDARVGARGFADVTADELKRHGGREPRLMAKIDHRGQLPRALARRGWGILPTRRGGYRIGPFGMFAELPEPPRLAHPLTVDESLETVRAGRGLSETAALFLLQASGAFADFAGEESMAVTSFGRRGTGAFSFAADGVPVDVDRAQMEIDALLEGPGSIAVVEAKREGDGSYLLRQLFYPWRSLSLEHRKPVRPMYLVVGDTGLRLLEFAFDDPSRHDPPRLVAQRRWVFAAESWRHATLADLAAGPAAPEPDDVPFPQADSVDRLLAFVAAVGDGRGSREELGQECAFVDRQVDYYGNAARYLGFLGGAPGRQELTDAGRELLAAAPSERSFPVARAVLAHAPFRRILAGEDAAAVIADARPDLGAATVRRRARTARSWIEWLREREAAARGGAPPGAGGTAALF